MHDRFFHFFRKSSQFDKKKKKQLTLQAGLTTIWIADNRILLVWYVVPLQWRHNRRDGVSNHQPHDCLLSCLFRCRSKKTSKLRATGLCEGNSPVTGEFPHKWPVTREMFLFDDVIMHSKHFYVALPVLLTLSHVWSYFLRSNLNKLNYMTQQSWIYIRPIVNVVRVSSIVIWWLTRWGPWVASVNQGGVSIRKTVLPGMAIPMLKIRRPNGRLIFNMEIAIRR